MPNVVLEDYVFERQITPFAAVLYLVLVWAARSKVECYPSLPYLVDKTGYSKSHIKEGLKELKEAGLIEILTGAESSKRSNTYVICDVSGEAFGEAFGTRSVGVRQAFGVENGSRSMPQRGQYSDSQGVSIVPPPMHTQERPQSQVDTEDTAY